MLYRVVYLPWIPTLVTEEYLLSHLIFRRRRYRSQFQMKIFFARRTLPQKVVHMSLFRGRNDVNRPVLSVLRELLIKPRRAYPPPISLEQMRALVGKELGTSDWLGIIALMEQIHMNSAYRHLLFFSHLEVSQARINAFADATADHQVGDLCDATMVCSVLTFWNWRTKVDPCRCSEGECRVSIRHVSASSLGYKPRNM